MRGRQEWRLSARRLAAATAIAVSLFAVAAVTAGPAAAHDTSPDWMHVLYTAGDLAARPPEKPLVILLGGSLARESTVSDTSWAAQVLRRGGPEVLTYNLASSNQTFAEDRWLVGRLPPVPTIVLVGVNLGRFTASPTAAFATTPAPYATRRQHRYSVSHILSVERKRELVRDWLARRYPVFKERYAYNVGVLDAALQRCVDRGLHPVLIDMPRNRPIIGHAFDVPVKRYHADMQRLAEKYSTRFINYVRLAGLVNGDFFDLGHLVEPGRTKWQKLLSDRTITLLAKYGMGTAGATSAPAVTSAPVAVSMRKGKGGSCSAPSHRTSTTRSSA